MSDGYENNAELLRQAREGDENALASLVGNNMGLVRRIAQRFRDRGTEYEDLVQIGTIGMIKAIRGFDLSYGTAFSTYAVPLIIGEIRRFLRDDGLIRVSRELKKQGISVLGEKERLSRTLGREPRLTELAAATGLTPETISEALDAVSPVRSLSEPQGEDGLTLEGTIAERTSEIDRLTDRLALREAIGKLNGLQRQILSLRYDRCLSQEQTGRILGLTQVKISREEKKIMTALREELKG